MPLEPEQHRRLLELVYDVLPEHEAAELRRQIEADPDMAAAHAQAQRTAGLLAEAGRLEFEPIELTRPQYTVMTPAETARLHADPKPTVRKPAARRAAPTPQSRVAVWFVAAASLLLLGVSLGGLFYHRGELAEIAAEHLRVQVSGPAKLQAGVTNRFSVMTTSVTGRPVSAKVEFALLASDGKKVLTNTNEATDEQGRLVLSIPPDKIPAGQARLQITAASSDKTEEVDTRLAVDAARYQTQLSLDRPLYRPGDTVYYRSLTLIRFGLAEEESTPVHFEILGPSGAAVAGSSADMVTRRGVADGAFDLPEGLPGGKYTLVVRSPGSLFPEERQDFFVRAYRLPRLKKQLEFARDSYTSGDKVVADVSVQRAEGGPAAGARLNVTATVDGQAVHHEETTATADGAYQVQFALPSDIHRGEGQLAVVVDDGGTRETIAKTIPINLGRVDVQFFPEGGELVADLEDRVYFTSRDLKGDPVHISGKVVDSRDEAVAVAETAHEGMGMFTFTPAPGESYRLEVEGSPAVPLPAASERTPVVLTTGLGIFEPGQPLEFNVRAAKEGLPLVAAAWCRGVLVGQQTFVSQEGANEVRVDVPDDIGGVIRLTVFDYQSSPPVPLAERLVYRRPAHRLQVRLADHHERYSPGEKAAVSLVVTDESGKPSPAVLGVSVVDDTLLNLADDDTPRMATHFLLASELEKPDDLEKLDFYLSDDPKAASSLDLLLGTQGWRRFVDKTLPAPTAGGRDEKPADHTRLAALEGMVEPPLMFDNLESLQRRYDQSLQSYHADRTQVLNTLTVLSLFGGAGLMLLVSMLALLGIASGPRIWIPSVVATGACLVIGAILINPQGRQSGSRTAVAYASFDRAPPPVTRGGVELEALGKLASEAPPAAAAPAAPAKASPEALLLFGAPMDGMAGDARQEERMAMPQLRQEIMDAAKAEPRDLERLERAKQAAAADLDENQLEAQYRLGNVRERRAYGGRDRHAGVAGKMARKLKEQTVLVRQYAHIHRSSPAGQRTDFAETLYWHPLLIAGDDGRAKAEFDLCDSITAFRIRVDAHSGGGGRLGFAQGEIIARIPFNLQPKLPLEVTSGDRVDLPLAVVNDSSQSLPVTVLFKHGDLVKLEGQPERRLEIAADKRAREYFRLDVAGQKGDCELAFQGTAGELADAVKRPLRVVPPGFPKSLSLSGRIEGDQEVSVPLPDDWVQGSLEVSLHAFPTSLADLQRGMDGMLREPYGCFEQASTTNYPNVLALRYLEDNKLAAPEITRRARGLLEQGYGRLTGYETPGRKGYEWFGADPGHEALTAYGLMEFRDMAKVYAVDAEMLRRTAQWLMGRRDGKGGFLRNPKSLDSFGAAPPEITDTYITWALAEAGQQGIESEIVRSIRLAEGSDDPYLVALAAGAALDAGKTKEAKPLLDKLAKWQDADGHLEGKQGSITRSGGQSLRVETTALAALAWMKSPEYAASVRQAIDYLTRSRQGGGDFGSTQATIMALKALLEHGRLNRRTTNAGNLVVKRGDDAVGQQAFAAGRQEAITLAGLEAKLKPGENRLVLSLTGGNQMPYAMDVRYRVLKPPSDEACPVRLTTSLSAAQVKEGQTVALSAELTNVTDRGQPMTVAILGLPAGLEPRPDQLEELKKAGTFDFYETRAREVICYWRSLAPKRVVSFHLDLIAAVPGRYVGPASCVYLYYTPESKHWAGGLTADIPRE